MGVVSAIALFLCAVLGEHAAIAGENLALCQQLGVLQASVKRPRLRKRDRIFWVWLSRLWSGWRSCLMIVRPETVIPRMVESPNHGRVIAIPQVGGLRHRYTRAA